ncbi:hypothetical protein [Melissospora conviva]|uniref:hypothetical protein n=1 Tax=Melissospora conviva TaxID=3388432 RepID=UPI003B7666CB
MRARAALAAAGLALLTALAGAAPAVAAEPALTVAEESVRAGDKLSFALRGWPAGTVHAELCGNEAARGSTDCATSAAVQFYVPATGKASGRLTVVAPPVACPCVLRVTTLGAAPTTRTAPVALKGVKVEAAVETVAPARLRVADLAVVSTGGRAALLGWSDEMVVRVALRNEGTVAVTDATMHLLTGRPGRAGEVVPAPQLGVIAPGQTREYLIRVPVGAPVFGAYELSGEVRTAGGKAAFVAEAESYPWALVALPGLLLLLALLRVVLRRRPATAGPEATPAA